MVFREVDSVYRLYFPVIRAKCRRMLADADEAQDLAQETFIRLWQSELSGLGTQQIVSWIYRTATRLAVDRLRQRAARPGAESEAIDHQEQAPGHESAVAARQLLSKVCKRLKGDELELFILRRLDGMKEQEIAMALDISDRTVRRRAAALDERLEQILAELDHGA